MGGNPMMGMGGMGMGGMGMGGMANAAFDPSAMMMMYQNMMKGSGMGESPQLCCYEALTDEKGGMGMGGGGVDPNAMAMMYQNMMKSEFKLIQ